MYTYNLRSLWASVLSPHLVPSWSLSANELDNDYVHYCKSGPDIFPLPVRFYQSNVSQIQTWTYVFPIQYFTLDPHYILEDSNSILYKVFIIWAHDILWCNHHANFILLPIVDIPTASISVNHRLLVSFCFSHSLSPPGMSFANPYNWQPHTHVQESLPFLRGSFLHHIRMEPVTQISNFAFIFLCQETTSMFIHHTPRSRVLFYPSVSLPFTWEDTCWTILFSPFPHIFFTNFQHASVNFKVP